MGTSIRHPSWPGVTERTKRCLTSWRCRPVACCWTIFGPVLVCPAEVFWPWRKPVAQKSGSLALFRVWRRYLWKWAEWGLGIVFRARQCTYTAHAPRRRWRYYPWRPWKAIPRSRCMLEWGICAGHRLEDRNGGGKSAPTNGLDTLATMKGHQCRVPATAKVMVLFP